MACVTLLLLVIGACFAQQVNALDCIFGAEYLANGADGKVYKGELEVVTCPPDWFRATCQRYEMNVTYVGGDKGPLVFGQCVPNGNCPYNTCSLSGPKLMGILNIISSIDDCITGCCETDRCNQQTVEEIKASGSSARSSYASTMMILTLAFITIKTLSSVY